MDGVHEHQRTGACAIAAMRADGVDGAQRVGRQYPTATRRVARPQERAELVQVERAVLGMDVDRPDDEAAVLGERAPG